MAEASDALSAIDTAQLFNGRRQDLARAITLVESHLPAHRAMAEELIETVLPKTGNSVRIGVSGSPGVGKSSFIETFGLNLIERGKRVAVLAVDPSSPLAGGSILGDKTRMEELSQSEAAYIRPSPAGSALGGVANRTREAMLLCEASGYDVILIETVGVGQSEHAVAKMSDFFLLLMLPNSGDELQGIKRGILELADAVAVNKCDGENRAAAEKTRAQYESALRISVRDNSWQTPAICCSATDGSGLDELAEIIETYCQQSRKSGAWSERRGRQNVAWMESLFREKIAQSIDSASRRESPGKDLSEQVFQGRISPQGGARELLRLARQSLMSAQHLAKEETQ